MTKVCDECGKPIGLFGGSWEVNGKTVCSKCEQKIRSGTNEEKTEAAPKIEEEKLKVQCPKCGAQNPRTSKFCNNCGERIQRKNLEMKQNKGKEKIPDIEPRKSNVTDAESVEVRQKTTNHKTLDLKVANNLVSETQNTFDNLLSEAENQIKNGLNVNVFEKHIINKMENDLKTADNLAKKVKSIDPNVVIKDPFTNEMITCDHVISLSCFLMGVIGYNFVIYQGRRNIDANKRILRRSQLNYIESNSIMPTDAAQYNIALAMDAQTEGIIRIGEFILDIDGKRIFLTPLSSKKAKKLVFDAYQKVIDLYPDSELAVKARRMQTDLNI